MRRQRRWGSLRRRMGWLTLCLRWVKEAWHTPGLRIPCLRSGGPKAGHLLGTSIQLPLESAVPELCLWTWLCWEVLPPLPSQEQMDGGCQGEPPAQPNLPSSCLVPCLNCSGQQPAFASVFPHTHPHGHLHLFIPGRSQGAGDLSPLP